VVLGSIAPQLHAEVFQASTLAPLRGLSDLGLVLFMFIVGAELRLTGNMRRQLVAATSIGALSVLLPMAVGLGLASLLYARLARAVSVSRPSPVPGRGNVHHCVSGARTYSQGTRPGQHDGRPPRPRQRRNPDVLSWLCCAVWW